MDNSIGRGNTDGCVSVAREPDIFELTFEMLRGMFERSSFTLWSEFPKRDKWMHVMNANIMAAGIALLLLPGVCGTKRRRE